MRSTLAPPSKVPSERVMTTSPEACEVTPPESTSTSTRRLPPRSALRPGALTSPTTSTNWLWYSVTFTSTCGSTRKSLLSSVVSLRCTSDTVRPATWTSLSRGTVMLPLGWTVAVRERSLCPSTLTSTTSPGPTRYSASAARAAGDGEGDGTDGGAGEACACACASPGEGGACAPAVGA